MQTSFAIDWRAFWIAVLFLIACYFLYKRMLLWPIPHLKFSNLNSLQNKSSPWHRLPDFLLKAALGCLLLAFVDPHLFLPKAATENNLPPQEPVEGIAIYLILDQSGSMAEKVDAILPNGSRRMMSKMDLLKEVTKEFVEGRPSDMIGLVGFARSAQVLDPLTLDHQAILGQLDKLDIQRAENQEGTSMGYAIYKTANLIAATRHYAEDLRGAGQPAYLIKSAIMILVTDGVPEVNPLDLGKRLRTMSVPEAAAYAKKENIRLYIINVDPGFVKSEYEPFRQQMKEATESTGGQFFMAAGQMSLSEIYAAIDKLEKSRLPGQLDLLELKLPKDKLPSLYQRISLYPYLIGIGLLCLLGLVLVETVLKRKVP